MDAGELHEKRKAALDKRKRGYWEDAELEAMQPEYQHPTLRRDEWGILEVVGMPLCPVMDEKGMKRTTRTTLHPCTRPAGDYTNHEGTGPCRKHGGHFGVGNARGAILMAMAYADEMNVSPWEAMLSQVRLLANQVAWLRARVYEAEAIGGHEAVMPGGIGWNAVAMLEARGDRLAKVAKMAVDAGIASMMVKQIELEAENMMKAALAGLDAAGIEGDQRERLLDAMSEKLLALETNLNVQLTSS